MADFFTQGLDFKDVTIGRRGYNALTVKQVKGVIDLRAGWDLQGHLDHVPAWI